MTTQESDLDLGLENNTPPPDSHISTSAQINYWSSQAADVDGMLGGYPHVSRADIIGSKTFIAKVKRLSKKSPSTTTHQVSAPPASNSSSGKAAADTPPSSGSKLELVVDCGAGIGRITTGLLLNIAERVDIVEPVTKFTDVLRTFKPSPGQGEVGQIFNSGLETWEIPAHKRYDIVWIQWCLGHLTDAQAATFLRNCAKHLVEDGEVEGWIMVKENLSNSGFSEDIYDPIDSSVTRSDAKFKAIFEQAGLKIVREELQHGFPSELYPVKMYSLRPKQ